MKVRLSFALATAVATFSGCLADEGKGDEDDIPLDGKDDSFVNPSAHGVLTFGVASNAEFTSAEGFHSWTFKLSATAKVDLKTTFDAPNLDTVIYLYKRTSSSAAWGAYVEKNDDATSSTQASRLDVSLGKGEYRLLVKAYKRTMRGQFSVDSACTGAGCPPATPACAAAVALPADTGYGGTCGNKLAAIYEHGSVDASDALEVSVDDRCTAPALQRAAIDYYASYFPDVERDIGLTVETQVVGGTGSNGGTLVTVGDGGDESSITFMFDGANTLVSLYQHNQSPDVQFFCRAASAAAVSVPNLEDCMSALVSSIPHDGDAEGDFSLVAAPNNLPIGLGTHVIKPMQRYAAEAGTTSSTKLTVDGATWDLFDGKASRLTISASTKPATRFLANADMVLLESPTGKPSALVCE